MSSSLTYTWRKKSREGKLTSASLSLPLFAEVRVTEPAVPISRPASCPLGFIHIELPDAVRVTVESGVDTGALAWVLLVLR